jgi:hypothetical protein
MVFKVDEHDVSEFYDGPRATYWIVTPDTFSIMPPSGELKKLVAKPNFEVESKIVEASDVAQMCEWYVANDGDCFPLTNHLSYHDVPGMQAAVPDIVIDHAIDKFKALLYDEEIVIHKSTGILTLDSRHRVVNKLTELAVTYESLVSGSELSPTPSPQPAGELRSPKPLAVPTVPAAPPVPAKRPSAGTGSALSPALPKPLAVPASAPAASADETKRPPRAHRPAITDQLREAVWRKRNGKRDVGKCFVCGAPLTRVGTECGHIVAFIDGGATSVANMEPICRKCNRGMKDRNLLDYKKALGL